MNALLPRAVSDNDRRTLGTGGVFVAGVALVVSASTFVTEFTGFIQLGAGFAAALVLGFCVILPVALAAADLAVSHPQIGGIYRFVRSVIRGHAGRSLGLFCSLTFFTAFLFGSAGETLAGAHALRSLVRSEIAVEWFVPLMVAPAVVANICGLHCATWLTGGLLGLMLGVRWFVGVGGFAGWADTGTWQVAHLMPAGGSDWFGSAGVIAAGLAFALWSFAGIEVTGNLASEVRNPARSLPRGMISGLGVILVTTVVMGLGSIGTQSREEWMALLEAGAGEAPHLAVGAAMFGESGRLAMAAASVAATWSTLVIALAAVPRMIVAVSRDGLFFGPASGFFSRVHPRTGVPVRATLLVIVLQLGVILSHGAVVDCIYAAAYIWIFRYLILLGLAGANRWGKPALRGVLARPALFATVVIGSFLVIASWRFGFAGVHAELGGRVLAVLAAVLACTLLAWSLRPSYVNRLRLGPSVSVAPTPALSSVQ
jgi:basic amino acid/polyamine antiporter, APA family